MMIDKKSQMRASDETQNISVYDSLLREIEKGELLPGTRLREIELADRLGVSRTPIREALKLLEIEGLVSHSPGQGISVKQLGYAEVMELYDMRTVLEATAARLAANSASKLELHHLNEIQKDFASASSPDHAFKLNRKFHLAISHAAKNRYLLQSMSVFHKSLMLLGRTTLDDTTRLQEAIIEHENILKALSKRDGDGAEKIMRAHIEASQKRRIHNLLNEDA